MPYCPECGGEMRYDSMLKRYICKSCGLSVTYEELNDMRDRVRDRPESDEDKRKKRRKESMDWCFSKKG